MRKAWPVVAVMAIFFGFLISKVGYTTLREWSSIGAGYSACGVPWALAGPTMFVAGCWVLLTLGRRATPLWLAGAGSIVAGGAVVVGVLTHVVPCSGPS
jgi:hypothetical protein